MARLRGKAVTIKTPEKKGRSAELHLEDLRRQILTLSHQVVTLRQETYNIGAVSRQVRISPLRLAVWVLVTAIRRGPVMAARYCRAYLFLAASGRFDADFYAGQTGQTGLRAEQLLRHYISYGEHQGLDPAQTFSVAKYLANYSDVRTDGQEPFSHYLRFGEAEHRIATLSSRATEKLSARHIEPAPTTMEETSSHPWPMIDKKGDRRFGPYDIRPDDNVPGQGIDGNDFLKRFALLTEAPDFIGAVRYLNDLTPAAKVISEGGIAPDVSIVIPVYGELAYTLNCVDALLRHESKYSFEIIVGDDASPDKTADWLPRLKNIRYVRHPVNGGFIANCNRTAAHAAGRTLVLLNNDTRVVAGWLNSLIDSFATFPKAGMVGSKLFYPDGELQEAGGIVWRDGSAWNYGRNDDPNRPRYCYARQVDYVSGCSIAIPKAVWDELGGFDSHFAPAYCEDVDLCFRLRQAGYETWFQPSSRVIHYEGKTSGTDTGAGVKAYQVANTKKLYARWKSELASHRPNAQEPWLERERSISKRVLIIDACNPTPWKDAGSLAIVNLFRYYHANGYQVSFAPENLLYEPRAVDEMQAMGVQAFYAPYINSLRTLLEIYGRLYDSVHVIRADVAFKVRDLIADYAPQAKAIFQNCDLHYLRMERQAVVENKPELMAEAQAMKIRELQLSRDFDLTITHSHAEKQILDQEQPGEDVLVMPLIENVVTSQAPFSGRRDFMFLGGYGHTPNVDAALWLIDDIWPAISRQLPQARLLLVGANPPSSVLERASDRIVVTGLVDDLSPWFDQTRLFLAALRYGAGAKGKVLASLAHGVPVVATDIAAEGLPLKNGETVFTANSAAEIVAEALRLYGLDETKWRIHSTAAQAYIREHHSFETGVQLLKKALAPKDFSSKA